MKRSEAIEPLPAGHIYEFDGGVAGERKDKLPVCAICKSPVERVSVLDVWQGDLGRWVRRSGLHCIRRNKKTSNFCAHFEVLSETVIDRPPPPGARLPVPSNEEEKTMPPPPIARQIPELDEAERAEILSALAETDLSRAAEQEVAGRYRVAPISLRGYLTALRREHKRPAVTAERLKAARETVRATPRTTEWVAALFGIPVEMLTITPSHATHVQGVDFNAAPPEQLADSPCQHDEGHGCEEPSCPSAREDVLRNAAREEELEVVAPPVRPTQEPTSAVRAIDVDPILAAYKACESMSPSKFLRTYHGRMRDVVEQFLIGMEGALRS